MQRRIGVVIGTRPEAIKMAPVIRALKTRRELATLVISVAQHRQMLDQALSLFGIVPDIDLDVMQPDQDLVHLTARALTKIGSALSEIQPELVLVQGDTTTTLAAALAAFYAQIPVVHVEAGLRTRDIRSPFPEEMNRRATGVVSEIHLAPTATARRALLEEGVTATRISVTGNTVVDALGLVLHCPFSFANGPLAELDQGGRTLLVTSHRRESFGRDLEHICHALRDLVARFGDVRVVYPVHMNPRVRETVMPLLEGVNRVHLLDPVDYLTFVNLMRRATVILTDSGGVQEEAPTLQKPLLVLRRVTERPEAFQAGLAKVIGTTREAIVSEVSRLLLDASAYRAMVSDANPYGDGRASERIADVVCRRVAGAEGPWLDPSEEFNPEAALATR